MIRFLFLMLAMGCKPAADTDPDPEPEPEPEEAAALDPTTIPKFELPLIIPPAMPPESVENDVTSYRIAMRQIEQRVLPEPLPMTTVWAYGPEGQPGLFHAPSLTVEARSDETVRVEWINGLVDDDGDYLPHLLPVDQMLHWANPPGPIDRMGSDPEPYTGPVPMVTHLHGGHTPAISDGYPEAWWLPDAGNIPSDYAREGSLYDSVEDMGLGAALFEYPNDQRAGTLWYHDHALGITRLNVYAGPAGFWLLRDDVEDSLDLPGPAPAVGDPVDTQYYEIPLAIQDRSFHEDGSLDYPASRSEFDGYDGPTAPDTEVFPIWNPETFGNTVIVNGRTWPYLEVEPRLYRFRVLNGTNARTLILEFDDALSFTQIGNGGGFLPDAPIVQSRLVLGPAERADVIVDFSGYTAGDELVLQNLGPDGPFKGLAANQDPADPQTTGQVMQFKVVEPTGEGNAGNVPTTLPSIEALQTSLEPRVLTLNEAVDEEADVPTGAFLGTGAEGALTWGDPITENPLLGDTEIWQVLNLTEDAHPIHLHLVMFQVLGRQAFDSESYAHDQHEYLEGEGPEPDLEDYLIGDVIPPLPAELGWKDTVTSNPGEVTRVIATFDMPGLYVWHCHVLEHEDNEMMRPFEVLTP